MTVVCIFTKTFDSEALFPLEILGRSFVIDQVVYFVKDEGISLNFRDKSAVIHQRATMK